MHSLYSLVADGNKIELLKLYVDEIYTPNSDNTIKRAYKLNGYKIIQPKVGSGLGNKAYSTSNSAGTIFRISDLFKFVKQNDSEFSPNPSSLVLNEDGTPKIVYHGTQKFGFSIFDPSKSDDKRTLFFTDSKGMASSYSTVESVKKLSDVSKKDVSEKKK